MGIFSLISNEDRLKSVMESFPAAFERARVDWAKFKVGVEYGVYTRSERQAVLDWYRGFLKTWEGIRPDWQITTSGGLVSAHKYSFLEKVDAWVNRVRVAGASGGQLGLVISTVVFAGFVVAAFYAGAWIFDSYVNMKEQENTTRIIALVEQGDVPPEVLTAAISAETGGDSFFGGIMDNINDAAKLGMAGIGLYFAWPWLSKLNSKMSKR